jgi:cell division septum initiation protein DivIVA
MQLEDVVRRLEERRTRCRQLLSDLENEYNHLVEARKHLDRRLRTSPYYQQWWSLEAMQERQAVQNQILELTRKIIRLQNHISIVRKECMQEVTELLQEYKQLLSKLEMKQYE